MSRIVSEAVAAAFPEDPPRFVERVPFAYFDEDRILGELELAGFENVEIETVEKTTQLPTARELAVGLCQGSPLRGEIESRAPERLDEVTEKAAEAVAARFGQSAVENRMSALVVTARQA